MLSKKRTLQVTAMIWGSLHFFACSSNIPAVSTISAGPAGGCPLGIGGMDPSCCDSGGVVIYPPASSTCGVITPGAPILTGTIGAGSASGGSSAGENTTAASMVGGQKMGTGGLANEASAATAGQTPIGTSLTGLGLPLGQSGIGVTSSGNAGGGGQNGIGDSSVNSIATAPAPSGSPDPSTTGADSGAGAQGSQYSNSGGGSGLLPNGAHSTGFLFGNGLSGASGEAGPAEIGFGSERNPASMASEDPSDYFTRIGLEDSLFKKVEKRYRSTSANWETASLNAIQLKTPK